MAACQGTKSTPARHAQPVLRRLDAAGPAGMVLRMRSHLAVWSRRLSISALLALSLAIASLTFSPAAGAASGSATTHWVWPLSGQIHVLRRFEPPSGPYAPGHRGVDLSTTVGQQVHAAGSGVVTFTGSIGGTPMVTVTHGALRTTYQPVAASVHVAELVVAGESIGAITIAPTHCGLLPSCLHWGLLRGSTYLDPLTLVGAAQVRLLPHLQLGPPSSTVVTLATGSGQQTTLEPVSRVRTAERVRTADTSASPQQSHTEPSSPPRALLASAGAVAGAALGFGTGVRRRRRRRL